VLRCVPPFAVLFMMNFNLFYFVNTWSVVFYHFFIVLLIDLLIRLPWIVPDSLFYCNLYKTLTRTFRGVLAT